jgi:hypothetical protein
MARYRTKDDVDLAWNQIRRRITRELDIQLADWREKALNNLLGGAWTKFSESLSRGEVLALESDYESWVARALDEAVTIKPVEADDDAPLAA